MQLGRRQILAGVILAVLALLYLWAAWDQAGEVAAESDVERLFREKRSGIMVEVEGEVDRVLADDVEGSRHQRFIIRLESGQTLLVSHNIDLAPRVESIEPGDRVTLRGQFEWNERGGVVHWTHHDPDGRRQGGWVRHQGVTYR